MLSSNILATYSAPADFRWLWDISCKKCIIKTKLDVELSDLDLKYTCALQWSTCSLTYQVLNGEISPQHLHEVFGSLSLN